MLTSAVWTIDWFSSVPKWGKQAAGFAIMGNTNIWELGAFKAAAKAGNCLHWWGDSVTIRLNLCWGAAKIWQEIDGLFIGNCQSLCYIPINCIREDTEQRVFCLLDTDWDSTQPSFGGDEGRGLIPRKHCSPCRKTQTNFEYFFSTSKGFLFSSTHKTSKILCICRTQGGEKGQVGPFKIYLTHVYHERHWHRWRQVWQGCPVSNQAARTLLPPAWTQSELAWTHLQPLGKAARSSLTGGFAEPVV